MVAPLAMMGMKAAASIVGAVGDALSSKPDPASTTAQTRKTANDFESMFLEETLNRVTQASGEDGPLGDNGTNGIHRSMLVSQYAQQITKSGGVGIADQVYRQMLTMQEGAARGSA